jgi:hypothetical protein
MDLSTLNTAAIAVIVVAVAATLLSGELIARAVREQGPAQDLRRRTT